MTIRMMRVTGINKDFDIEISLVGSKSESNRALMICHYGGLAARVKNLSTSDDTILLSNILRKISMETVATSFHDNPAIIDCANAGSVLRFLATALSFRNGDYILTGCGRMLKRPVGDLVETLRAMGADIKYLGEAGFPPLKIHGKTFAKTVDEMSQINVNISKSSQFASSILLMLPTVKTIPETILHLDGDLSSLPYIDMTIDIMRDFGAKVERSGREIAVQPSEYQNVEYVVESDWTCASCWYEFVALSEHGRVKIRNLKLDSKQGDAVAAEWFEQLGVKTVCDGNDIIIEKNNSIVGRQVSFDFINNPDLYPAIAATCAGLNIKGRFTGLRNLVHKESDRVAAMAAELSKINSVQTCHGASPPIKLDSHDDHRIAMALAPLAMKIGAIEINNAEVVSKSYPYFWEEMKNVVSTESLGRSGKISLA